MCRLDTRRVSRSTRATADAGQGRSSVEALSMDLLRAVFHCHRRENRAGDGQDGGLEQAHADREAEKPALGSSSLADFMERIADHLVGDRRERGDLRGITAIRDAPERKTISRDQLADSPFAAGGRQPDRRSPYAVGRAAVRREVDVGAGSSVSCGRRSTSCRTGSTIPLPIGTLPAARAAAGTVQSRGATFSAPSSTAPTAGSAAGESRAASA